MREHMRTVTAINHILATAPPVKAFMRGANGGWRNQRDVWTVMLEFYKRLLTYFGFSVVWLWIPRNIPVFRGYQSAGEWFSVDHPAATSQLHTSLSCDWRNEQESALVSLVKLKCWARFLPIISARPFLWVTVGHEPGFGSMVPNFLSLRSWFGTRILCLVYNMSCHETSTKLYYG